MILQHNNSSTLLSDSTTYTHVVIGENGERSRQKVIVSNFLKTIGKTSKHPKFSGSSTSKILKPSRVLQWLDIDFVFSL